MIYAIIILSLLLIIFGVLAIRREYTFRITAKLQTSEIESNVANLAISLRSPNMDGSAPRTRSLLANLKRSYRHICKKVANDEDLYEFEKWLYENYYKVITNISSTKYNYFALLPSVKGKARVLIVADFLLSSNDNQLTCEHISEVIDNFNLYTPLDKDEVFALTDAIAYTCIQRITNICTKSKSYSRSKRLASIENFNKKEQSSDAYMYWRSRNGYLADDHNKATMYDGNLDNIEFSFTKTLVENCRVMSKCIKSLIYIEDNISLEYKIGLSYASQLMKNDDIYATMDIDSRLSYLNSIEIISRKYKIEEQSVVKHAMQLATDNNIHFGYYFFEGRRQLKTYIKDGNSVPPDHKSTKFIQNLFITMVFMGNIIASVALSIFGASSLWTLITFGIALFFALLPLTEFIIIYLFRLFLINKPTPKLNNNTVNDDAKTLVVMPCFVGSDNDAETVANAILRVRESNNMNNVNFALLVDYPSSESPKHKYFDDFTETITQIIDKYNDINLFIRKPVKSGNKYIAFEKKRGALMDLTDSLMRDNYDTFEYIHRTHIASPKFIVTLDSDNELQPGSILRSINTMLHPLNKKYDLMTFNAKYNLYSMNTLFSKRYYFDSGYDRYSNTDNFYNNLMTKSLFNGKGIFRLYEFYTKLYNVLPSGKILSHDILEGSLLNTGMLSEIVYEDAPNSIYSETSRKNRWLRGDLLLGGFLGSKIKNDNNAVTIIKKEKAYNHIIVSNILKSFSPIAMLLLLVIPLLYKSFMMAIPFIIAFGLDYIIRIFNALAGTVNGTRTRYVARCIISILIESFINLLILPFYAINNIVIISQLIFTAIFTPDKKLDWKPFSSSQHGTSLINYFILILPSVIFATIMSAVFYANPFMLGYFAIYVAVIISLYITGTEIDKKQFIKLCDQQFLLEIAKKTYKFFEECSINDLVVDNYQTKPYKGNAISTSPTNIGFSLLAEVSAYELGIISIESANRKIASKLIAVNRLRKYRGHLYNWYNIETKQILSPNVISSVDSGNFLASLITLKQFMLRHKLDNIDIVENLIANTDLDFMYDNYQQKFFISYNTGEKLYNGHYDILASESRILYYIYTSISHNTAAWLTLKRQTSNLKGNTLMSWSGTMFEYLMPRIFMTPPKNSLLEDTEKNIISISKGHKCKGLFGISESGYYQFDNNLKYQYHAFGLNEISIRNSRNSCVISPYSSFLCLQINANKVIENIRTLKTEDMVGEYGYYEAVDFTTQKNIVYSYMSHHQGMIITSIANSLRDNCISKHFECDSKMQGGRLLLGERRIFTKSHKIAKTDFAYNKNDHEDLITDDACSTGILTNGAYTYISKSTGQNVSIVNGNAIAKMRNYDKRSGLINYVQNNGASLSHSYRRCDNNTVCEKFTHLFKDTMLEYTNTGANISEEVYIPNCIKGEVHKFTINKTINDMTNINCVGYMDISISPFMDEISHTAFSDMFISSEKINENTVLFHRKSRDNGGDKFVGIKIIGLQNIVFETNKQHSIDINSKEIIWNDNEFDDSFGDVVTPCFSYNSKCSNEEMSTMNYYIVIVYSESKSEIISELSLIESTNSIDYLIESAKVKSISKVNKLFDKNADYKMALKLADIIISANYTDSALMEMNQIDYNNLMNEVNAGSDCKIIYYSYQCNPNLLVSLSKAIEFIKDIPMSHKLIIYIDDRNKNHDVIKNKVYSAFDGNIGQYLIISNYELSKRIEAISLYNISSKELFTAKSITQPENTIIDSSDMVEKSDILFKVKDGGFTSDSYLIENRTIKPYSNVICGMFGGTVVTTNGGGFTYFGNSRNDKVSMWSNNQLEDECSEKIMLSLDNMSWRLNKLYQNASCEHKIGSTSFDCQNLNIKSSVTECMLYDGKCKLFEVSLENTCADNLIFELSLDMTYALGVNYESAGLLASNKNNETITVANVYTKQCVYQRFIGYSSKYRRNKKGVENYIELTLPAMQKLKINCIISNDLSALMSLNQGNIIKEKNTMIEYFNDLNKINVHTDDKSFDVLFNKSLMYQTVSARLNGKCGFYQVGGAIGFRDQLQDCLAFIYSDPDYVRNHIIQSAKRQFVDGDVLHWWHNPNVGVRTRISDDKLFLPYVVSEYIRITGDRSILKENASYLTGRHLEPGVHDMYMSYNDGEVIEDIKSHCIRAINNSLKYGEHDILLIGSGDWNDALNNIGDEERGESVWLSMFCFHVITKFSKYTDNDINEKFKQDKIRLKRGIRQAYQNGWYARAYTKDNEWLGTINTEVCNIDLICQSFAVISGACPEKMAHKAMENASQLIDTQKGIVKLLSPPFNHNKNYGYISHYPSGVRENGGQYTHAVAWYIKALAMIDRVKAYDVLQMVNPINKAINNPEYNVEPYVMSADVYTSGAGGWTWYTGSSSWFYKVMIEDIIGINFDENILRINPKYIPKLGDIKVNIKRNDMEINITITKSNDTSMSVNNIINSQTNIYEIILDNDKKDYDIKINYKN